jgi:hypothetical protein
MNNIINKEKYILLDNLFNLFLESKYEKEDESYLKEEGIEISKIVRNNMMLFRQLNTQSKADLNKARHNRVKEFLSKLKNGIASNVEEYKNIADEIFAKPKFSEYQAMFRNFSDITEADKKSILMDSKLLDLLAEIEEEFNKEN